MSILRAPRNEDRGQGVLVWRLDPRFGIQAVFVDHWQRLSGISAGALAAQECQAELVVELVSAD